MLRVFEIVAGEPSIAARDREARWFSVAVEV